MASLVSQKKDETEKTYQGIVWTEKFEGQPVAVDSRQDSHSTVHCILTRSNDGVSLMVQFCLDGIYQGPRTS
jgi:hypothetical protein